MNVKKISVLGQKTYLQNKKRVLRLRIAEIKNDLRIVQSSIFIKTLNVYIQDMKLFLDKLLHY